MTGKQAVEVASAFAKQKNQDVSQYTSKATKKGALWQVYFQRKSEYKPRPGDFFTVYVDDQSGSAKRIVYGK